MSKRSCSSIAFALPTWKPILYYKLEFHPDGKKILGVFRAGGKDHGLAWFDFYPSAIGVSQG
jgi:hypothetical protein